MQTQVPRSPAPASALEKSLHRVLRKQKRARKKTEVEAVHDARVALRRCRSLAEGYAVIDLHSVWKRVDKLCKKQQRGLNDLRDVQVLSEWVKKLRLAAGPAGEKVSAVLKHEEKRANHTAKKSLDAFPRKRWKRWMQELPRRADLIPVGDARLASLALERLNEVFAAERHWQKTYKPADWHKVRIAMKRFRYTVESFLPEQYQTWEPAMKRLQNVLGEGHDLDVLRDWVVQFAEKHSLAAGARKQLLTRIDRAHRERQKQFMTAAGLDGPARRSASGNSRAPKSVLDRWKSKLEGLAGVSKT